MSMGAGPSISIGVFFLILGQKTLPPGHVEIGVLYEKAPKKTF